MAAFANFSLADGQATPVNHPFQTAGSKAADDKYLFDWRDTSVNGGALAGANRLRVVTRLPSIGTKVGRGASGSANNLMIETFCYVPTMRVVSGANSAGYTASPDVACETYLYTRLVQPGIALAQTAKDANAFTRALLLNAFYTDIQNSMVLP